jgi:hypothetical protein
MSQISAGPKALREVIGHTLLTVIAAILFAIGWTVGKFALAASWIGAAIRIGWEDAHKKREQIRR